VRFVAVATIRYVNRITLSVASSALKSLGGFRLKGRTLFEYPPREPPNNCSDPSMFRGARRDSLSRRLHRHRRSSAPSWSLASAAQVGPRRHCPTNGTTTTAVTRDLPTTTAISTSGGVEADGENWVFTRRQPNPEDPDGDTPTTPETIKELIKKVAGECPARSASGTTSSAPTSQAKARAHPRLQPPTSLTRTTTDRRRRSGTWHWRRRLEQLRNSGGGMPTNDEERDDFGPNA
jgi:hypothetical protein